MRRPLTILISKLKILSLFFLLSSCLREFKGKIKIDELSIDSDWKDKDLERFLNLRQINREDEILNHIQGKAIDEEDKKRVFVYAAKFNYLELAKQVSNAFNSLEELNFISKKKTALGWASQNGHENIVEWLVEKAKEVCLILGQEESLFMKEFLDHKDSEYGKAALMYAVSNAFDKKESNEDSNTINVLSSKRKKIVDLLLKGGADLDVKTNNDQTVLMFAAKRGHKLILEFLIDESATKGKDIKESINLKDANGYTASMAAAERNHLEVVKFLIDKDKDVIYNKSKDNEESREEKDTLLTLAVKYNHYEMVEYLINLKDVDLEKLDIEQAFHLSIKKKKNIFDLLIRKLSVEKINQGYIREVTISIPKPSKKGQIVVEKITKKEIIIPIIEASKYGRIAVLETLLEMKIDIDKVDENKMTALMWACKNNRKEVVELLLKKGADRTRTSNRNETAFILVCKQNSFDNNSIKNGLVPCCQEDKRDILNLLIFNKKSQSKILELLKIKDKYSKSALDYAEFNNYNKLVKLIKSKIESLKDENKKVSFLNIHFQEIESVIKKSSNPENLNKKSDTGINEGKTFLMVAAINGSIEITKKIIEEAKRNNQNLENFFTLTSNQNKRNAIIYASRHCRIEVLRYLLKEFNSSKISDKKVVFDLKDKKGKSALIHASEKGYKDIFDLLVENNASTEGSMEIACKNGRFNILESLKIKKDLIDLGESFSSVVDLGFLEMIKNLIEEIKNLDNLNLTSEESLKLAEQTISCFGSVLILGEIKLKRINSNKFKDYVKQEFQRTIKKVKTEIKEIGLDESKEKIINEKLTNFANEVQNCEEAEKLITDIEKYFHDIYLGLGSLNLSNDNLKIIKEEFNKFGIEFSKKKKILSESNVILEEGMNEVFKFLDRKISVINKFSHIDLEKDNIRDFVLAVETYLKEVIEFIRNVIAKVQQEDLTNNLLSDFRGLEAELKKEITKIKNCYFLESNLILAIVKEWKKVVETLAEMLLNKEFRNLNFRYKKTMPLIYSLESKNNGDEKIEIFNFLLEKGANPDQDNDAKRTVLILACFWNKIEFVNSLLEYGASVAIKDDNNYDAEDWAISHGYSNLSLKLSEWSSLQKEINNLEKEKFKEKINEFIDKSEVIGALEKFKIILNRAKIGNIVIELKEQMFRIVEGRKFNFVKALYERFSLTFKEKNEKGNNVFHYIVELESDGLEIETKLKNIWVYLLNKEMIKKEAIGLGIIEEMPEYSTLEDLKINICNLDSKVKELESFLKIEKIRNELEKITEISLKNKNVLREIKMIMNDSGVDLRVKILDYLLQKEMLKDLITAKNNEGHTILDIATNNKNKRLINKLSRHFAG